MKIELNKLYNYLYGDWADIEKHIKKDLSPELKAKLTTQKTQSIKDFFAQLKITLNSVISSHENVFLEKIFPEEKLRPQSQEIGYSSITEELYSFEHHFCLLRNEEGVLLSPQTKILFHEYYRIAKLVADKVEKNNDREDHTAKDQAYKMLVIFGNDPNKFLTNVDKYLDRHNYLAISNTPLHDALVFALPCARVDRIHLNDWRKLIQKEGPRLFKLFNMAPAIEKKLNGRCPKNWEEARETAKSIRFKNSEKYPKLADLFLEFSLSEFFFEKTLVINKSRKQKDNLPSLSIHGKDIDAKYADYHLVKLPIDDPVAYVLGNITNCCQHMGGASEMCVIDGVTRENNGFYVLLKIKRKPNGASESKSTVELLINGKINYQQFDIVGQGYAWLSEQDNLVFDSWENKSPEREDEIIVPLLAKFAQEVVEQKDSKITRVMIGNGGKTPEFYKNRYITFPTMLTEVMIEGEQYVDSTKQSTIFCNDIAMKTYIDELDTLPESIINKIKISSGELTALKRWLTSTCYSKSRLNLIKTIITPDDIQFILRRRHYAKIPIDIFIILKQTNLMTEQNVDIAYLQNTSNDNCRQLWQVVNSGEQLNVDVYKKILTSQSTLNIKEIIRILCRLREANLNYYREILDFILSKYVYEYSDFLTKIILAFEILRKANIVEEEDVRGAILKHDFNADYVNELANALTLLHEATLDNDRSIRMTLLESKKPMNAVRIIFLLKEAELHNNTQILEKACESQDEMFTKSVILAVKLLKTANLYSKEYKDFQYSILYSADPEERVKVILLLRDNDLLNELDLRLHISKIFSLAYIRVLINAFALLRSKNLISDSELRDNLLNSYEPLALAQSLVELNETGIFIDESIYNKIVKKKIHSDRIRHCTRAFKLLKADDFELDYATINLVIDSFAPEKTAQSMLQLKPPKLVIDLLRLRDFISGLEKIIGSYSEFAWKIFPSAVTVKKRACIESLHQLQLKIDSVKVDDIASSLLAILIKFQSDLVVVKSDNFLKLLKSFLADYKICIPEEFRISVEMTPSESVRFNCILREFKLPFLKISLAKSCE